MIKTMEMLQKGLDDNSKTMTEIYPKFKVDWVNSVEASLIHKYDQLVKNFEDVEQTKQFKEEKKAPDIKNVLCTNVIISKLLI